jgi:hypothetical protein
MYEIDKFKDEVIDSLQGYRPYNGATLPGYNFVTETKIAHRKVGQVIVEVSVGKFINSWLAGFTIFTPGAKASLHCLSHAFSRSELNKTRVYLDAIRKLVYRRKDPSEPEVVNEFLNVKSRVTNQYTVYALKCTVTLPELHERKQVTFKLTDGPYEPQDEDIYPVFDKLADVVNHIVNKDKLTSEKIGDFIIERVDEIYSI